MSENKLQRRRSTVRRLQQEGLGVREISRRTGIPASNVSRDLRAPTPEGGPPAPEQGNQRALVHGIHSAAALKPARERHERELAPRYPLRPQESIAMQALRLAQIEACDTFLCQRGVIRDERGRVFDAADRTSKWSTAAERWFAEADAEAREQAEHASHKSFGDVAAVAFDPAAAEAAHEFLRHIAELTDGDDVSDAAACRTQTRP